MRPLFEARLVNDAFGDPALYVDFRDERRALLFDLGDISVLPPRKLMRLSHIFVTRAHMDHFAGFDHLLRVVLGRKAHVALFGGPEFVAQVEHKLRASTWNVVHRYEVELVIDVHEIGVDGRGRRARFSSRRGFQREACASFELPDDVLHEEATFRVREAALSTTISRASRTQSRRKRTSMWGRIASRRSGCRRGRGCVHLNRRF
jgi:ribonuclease Z